MVKHTYRCSRCGEIVDLGNYGQNKPIVLEMKKKRQCFNCTLWLDLLENRRPNTYIINRGLYKLGELKKTHYVNGYDETRNGATFLIQSRTRRAFFTDNCKFLGMLPDSMKSYRDQYKFISMETFRKIRLFQADKCRLKGCYDRYHCFLYDLNMEKKKGAWNKIPDSHTVGDECCESFINKFNMYNV